MSLSQKICAKARSIGLDVYYEKETPGDGNCFYHSLIEGLQYNAVGKFPTYRGSHTTLRMETVDYVNEHLTSDFVVTWMEQNLKKDLDEAVKNPEYQYKDMVTIVQSENVRDKEKMVEIIRRQRMKGVYASELFIRAASILLKTAIVFTKETSTTDYQYDVFWPWEVVPADQSLEVYDGPYILIGHGNNHFQSLRFYGMPPWKVCTTSSMESNNNAIKAERISPLHMVSTQNKNGIIINKTPLTRIDIILKQRCEDLNISFEAPSEDESRRSCDKRRKRIKDAIKERMDIQDNSSLGGDISIAERLLKIKCDEQGIEYERPPKDETRHLRERRRKRMALGINEKLGVTVELSIVERELKKQCEEHDIEYLPPPLNETKYFCQKRTTKLKEQIKGVESDAGRPGEKRLKVTCEQHNIAYEAPKDDENRYSCNKRRKRLHVAIDESSGKGNTMSCMERKLGESYKENIANEMQQDDADLERKKESCVNVVTDNNENDADIDFHISPLENKTCVQEAVTDNEFDANTVFPVSTSNDGNIPDNNNTVNNSFLHSNPKVHEMIYSFTNGELHHNVDICMSCHEIRPQFHATNASEKFQQDGRVPPKVQDWKIKNGRCQRCHNEYQLFKSKGKVLTFSGIYSPANEINQCKNDVFNHNNMHFHTVPPFLANLTLIETLMIRKITVALYVHTLKYGMLASKGHAVSIPQDMKVHRTLPLLPKEIGILVLKSSKTKSKRYLASRSNVQNALEGLVFGYPKYGVDQPPCDGYVLYRGNNHISGIDLEGKYFLYPPNPYYADVTIDAQRLSMLSELPSYVDVPSIDALDDPELQDDGPAKEQFDHLDANEEIGSWSGIVAPLEMRDADDDLKKLLKQFVGDGALCEGKYAQVPFNNPVHDEKPLPELSTEGLFTQCYPHIFVGGSCDITIKRLREIDYLKWVEHIYYNVDNRVALHPFLKFHLLNIGLKKRALTQGSYCVSQQINEALLTVEQLQEKLGNEDEGIPRKIISFGSNLPNTDPYWRSRKTELDALHFFLFKELRVMPTYFDTSSCAEHHWEPLHKLLIKYNAKVTNKDEDDVAKLFCTDAAYRHKVINNNSHIVTSYFNARHINYENTVLKELLQFQDCWGRSEFAKSRGQIHNHSVYFSKQHYEMVKCIMQSDTDNQSKADQLFNWFQTDSMNTESVFSPNFVSMHPGGGKCNDKKKWIANKDMWLPPEGSFVVDNDVLSKSLHAYRSTEDIKNFQINVVNKVMLHNCNNYCLRRKRNTVDAKKSGDGVKQDLIRRCRFHFGEYNEKDKISSGKPISEFQAHITESAHPTYEGPRDHPRLVQHAAARPLSWLANCDTQPVIHHDLLALMKYIAGYACKGATTTSDMINIYANLLKTSPTNSSLKSIAQKLLLKSVGIVDTPGPAADFLNTGNILYRCSRRFRRIGLSGYRVLDTRATRGIVSKKSPLDDFLSEKRRIEMPDITLYDWAKICNCPKSTPCGLDHVPLFTGFVNTYTWPIQEGFAKCNLMMFSPGTWHKCEDLLCLNGVVHNDYTSAFAEFIDTEQCPEALKLMLTFAKRRYDNKIAKKNNFNKSVDIDISSQTSSQSQSSDTLKENSLGYELMRDIAIQQKCHLLNAVIDEISLPDGGLDFDWFSDGCKTLLGIHADIIESGKDWVTTTIAYLESVAAHEKIVVSLPEVNPLLVNDKQRLIVYINMSNLLEIAKGNLELTSISKRLLIQGCAGTGKSQVIKIITRLTRRLFKNDRSILNLAPTGAAAVILPDGRTVHSLINIPKESRKSDDSVSLTDYPMNQKSLKKMKLLTLSNQNELVLKCINSDERGMYGQKLTAWFNQRFCELSRLIYPDLESSIFGCVPCFNFSGDLFQLSAIGDKNLYSPPLSSSSPANISGYTVYRSFNDVVILDEVLRQKPSQANLLSILNNLRLGKVTQADWNNLNNRAFCNLRHEEKGSFSSSNPSLIYLTETWDEANKHNYKLLASLNVPVAVIPSTGSGKHHKDNLVGQIPSRCIVAIGSRVILTKNQKELTWYGLNNGAVGNVISIKYSEGKSPPHFPEYIVVDFQQYNGPPWDACHPTWVPISAMDGRCEDNCCSRMGFPLIPGYGITIAKSQGMTIGENEIITHAIIKLNPKIDMEKLNLGTAYTAFSRVCEEKDFCLAEKIPFERLEYINRHPQMKKRLEEEKRLLALAESTYDRYSCSELQYITLLTSIDDFCDDGIRDSESNK